MANLRYTPLQALTTNDIARESTDDTTSLPSLRRRQALERMKLRETEKQHQKDLDLNASLRSSQRRRAAVEIARAKRARITAKKRQQEERKQKTHEALGSKIQEILDRKGIRWAEKSNSIRVFGGESHPTWKRAVALKKKKSEEIN